MMVEINKCTEGLWYNELQFPVKTYVIEATKKIEDDNFPEAYNIFWNRVDNSPSDYYYSDELMGFILKEDCTTND